MPGEPVCRRERRAGESVVDSGYMEAGGKGDVANLPGVEFFHRDHRVYHFSVPLKESKRVHWLLTSFLPTLE